MENKETVNQFWLYLLIALSIISAMVFFAFMASKASFNHNKAESTIQEELFQEDWFDGAKVPSIQQKMNCDCNVHYENLLTLLSIYLYNEQNDLNVNFKEVLTIKNSLRDDNHLFMTTTQDILK